MRLSLAPRPADAGRVWSVIPLGGFVFGLVFERWWTLLAVIPLASWILATNELEGTSACGSRWSCRRCLPAPSAQGSRSGAYTAAAPFRAVSEADLDCLPARVAMAAAPAVVDHGAVPDVDPDDVAAGHDRRVAPGIPEERR